MYLSKMQDLNPKNNEEDNVKYDIVNNTRPKNSLMLLILEPFQWLQMLSTKLSPSFVFGAILVYGLSHGFSNHFFKVVSDYYWKDVQKVQPSLVQLFIGLYYIPWIMKPVWGLLTDVFPVKGYHRRPYFVLAGVLGAFSAVTVAVGGRLDVTFALACMMGITAGVAIGDVTIDACVARNSNEFRSLAADMQSLRGFCAGVGSFLGYATSGFFVHRLGPQGSLGLLAIPSAALFSLGFVIYELKTSDDIHVHKEKPAEKLTEAVNGMFKTIQLPQEFVGMIYAIGAVASMVGVIIYHKTLKNYPFRTLLFFAQLLYGISGMLDLVFMLRWNLAIGIPDYLFVVMEACVSHIISEIRWMPMMVLSSQLCPLGIEGTFFGLLMCIDSLGSLTSKWGGGMVLHLLHVTRTDFRNLWLTVMIRNILRLSTLSLIFLVPNVDSSEVSVPSIILRNTSDKHIYVDDDDEDLQLVPLNEKIEV